MEIIYTIIILLGGILLGFIAGKALFFDKMAFRLQNTFKDEVLAKGEFKKDINATIIFKDGKFVDIQVNLDKEPVE